MKKTLAVIALVAAVLGSAAGIAFADQTSQETLATTYSGGGIMSNNGQLDWSVPPGAYSVTIKMLYLPNSADNFPNPPANTLWVDQPFTIQMFDFDTGAMISADKPTTLTIHYIPSDLGGRSESTLRVVTLNGTQWVDMPSTVDTVYHVVIAQTPYSGSYGLIANDVGFPLAPPPAPTATPAPVPAPAPTAAPAPAPAPAPAAPSGSVISGKVFYDKNGNGVMDDGDFPIGGAGLLLTSGNSVAFTRTAPDGTYSLGGLGNGSYTVNLIVGSEWAFTTPFAVSGVTVTGQPDSKGAADFGMWYKLP